MTDNKILVPVQLIHKKQIISPLLITIREYGRWLQEVFDNYTCNLELFLRAKESGEIVLQYHPGTKIGNWFDRRDFGKPVLHSWYAQSDTSIMKWLKKYKLAECRDAVPISVNDKLNRKMIRLYTAEQIRLYITSNLDRNFKLEEYLSEPKQIKIYDNDYDKMIIPEIKQPKKSLF